MDQRTHVVVLGAGYAGLMAAMRLAKKTGPGTAITLINAAGTFQERVRNHQLLAGQPVPQLPLSSFLAGTRIRFLRGTVTAMQPSQRRVVVQTEDGLRSVEYDCLLYALGSFVSTDKVPGVREHAYTVDQTSTLALAERLPGVAARRGRVLIVGGGNTGVEVSTELAETYPDLTITVVTRRSFAGQLSPAARDHIRKAFARFGIRFVENTAITQVREGGAVTESGETIPFDVCVWVGGFGVSDLPRRAGLRVNERGQIIIDRAMRSVSHPEIYAVGDAAAPLEDPGAPVRMSVYTAVAMGAHGADSVAAQLAGRSPTAFGLSYAALGISLGRGDGVAQFLGASTDRPVALILRGKLANMIREFFVRLIVWAISGQRFAPWTFYWPGKSKMRKIAVRVPRSAAQVPIHADAPAPAER